MQDYAVVHIAHGYINALGKVLVNKCQNQGLWPSSSLHLSSFDFFIEHTKNKSVSKHSLFSKRTEIKLSAANFHYL